MRIRLLSEMHKTFVSIFVAGNLNFSPLSVDNVNNFVYKSPYRRIFPENVKWKTFFAEPVFVQYLFLRFLILYILLILQKTKKVLDRNFLEICFTFQGDFLKIVEWQTARLRAW